MKRERSLHSRWWSDGAASFGARLKTIQGAVELDRVARERLLSAILMTI